MTPTGLHSRAAGSSVEAIQDGLVGGVDQPPESRQAYGRFDPVTTPVTWSWRPCRTVTSGSPLVDVHDPISFRGPQKSKFVWNGPGWGSALIVPEPPSAVNVHESHRPSRSRTRCR
jgi:hypothetical protein